jgi:ubiquinone/menaquinone biosynthesis C-methylase UbiE
MPRILEPEVMESEEEAKAYDELDRLWGDVLFQGFAESALRMGVVQGRVLDVGCGPGRISVRLAKLNRRFQIDGIDLSKNMLLLAEQTAGRHGVSENTNFTLGDAKQIPFPDGTFDMVICHNFLHQLPEPLTALHEIKRVAKNNGAILIRDVWRLPFPLMPILLPFYCLGYGKVLRRLTYDSYYAGMTYREFAEMAKKASLDGVRVTRYFITHIGLERLAVPLDNLTERVSDTRPSFWRHALKSLYLVRRPS